MEYKDAIKNCGNACSSVNQSLPKYSVFPLQPLTVENEDYISPHSLQREN